MEENKRGGAREGAGRKTKAEEDNVTLVFLKALGQLYRTDTDEDTKVSFVKDALMDSQRGQLFIAEHLFGKPKEVIDQTINLNDFNIKDIVSFDKPKQ